MLLKSGRVRDGLALLDEAMVAVTAEEVSPIVTGIVYCGVILACQEVYEVRRAREWTRALSDWWALQPDMVAFTGRCLVHRAEIMQLDGAWPDALDEARRAGERFIEHEESCRGPRALPPGRAPPAAGRLLRRRGGVSGGEYVRLGAAAGPRPAATRAGTHRRRGLGHPARRSGHDGAARAGAPASGVRRDRARRRRRRRRPACVCRARGDRDADTRARCSARSSPTRVARYTSPTPSRARRSPRCGRRSRRGMPSTLRTRSHGRAPSSATRVACSATRRQPSWSTTRRGASSSASARRRISRGSRRSRARHGLSGTRARGASARRGRKDEPRDRGVARHQRAHRRASRPEHLREARAFLPLRRDGVRVRARPRLSIRARGQK